MKLGGGPATGTAFDLTVTSGGVSRQVSGQWKTPPSAPTVAITVTRRTLQAGPEVIAFDVSVSGFTLQEPASATDYDPTRHQLEYEWDFGDPGSLHPSTNLPTFLRDANKAFGKSVAHYFAAAGTYTVQVTVRDPATGETATTFVNVTINAVTSGFDAADINYIDPDGLYTDAPVGSRTYTSLQTFLDEFRVQTYTTPQLVYLRRGVTHDIAGASFNQSGNQLPSLMIMSDPATGGADAILNHTGSGSFFASQAGIDPARNMSLVFLNVEMTGQYDSLTQTGGTHSGLFSNGSQTTHSLSVMDCSLSGFGPAINSGYSLFFMANSYITNWSSYAFFGSNFTGHWQVGNRYQRPLTALSGGPDETGYNSGAIVRFTGGGKFVNIGFDYFQRAGWPLGTSDAYRIEGPCMRMFTNGDSSAASIGAKVNIHGGIGEGGGAIVDFQVGGGVGDSVPVNAVVERIIGVTSPTTREMVFTAYGGVTVRNNLFVRMDIPRFDSGYRTRRLVAFVAPDTAPEAARPQRILGNTFLNLISNANEGQPDSLNPEIFNDDDDFDTVIAASNYIHSPNLDTPSEPYTNIDDTTALFLARHIGYRSRYQRLTFNTADYGGDWANGADLVIPLTDINASLTLAAVDTTPFSTDTHVLNNSTFGSGIENITFAFDATNVTMTNNSGGTLSGNYTVNIFTDDDAFINLQSEFAQTGDAVPTGIPLVGSTNTGIDTELAGWKDFYGVVRPASHSRGAIEIAS